MQIKINEILLIASLLIAVLTYYSAYSKHAIKNYVNPEVNQTTMKSFNVTLIFLYLLPFGFSGIASILIINVTDFVQYYKWIFLIISIPLIVITFIAYKQFSKKLRQKMDHIFKNKSIYRSDEMKFQKNSNYSYLFLIFSSIIHAFLIALFWKVFGEEESFIGFAITLFLLLLVLLLGCVDKIQAYAILYSFKEYRFYSNGKEFIGWLISEDDMFFTVKINRGAVRRVRKDQINYYECN